MVLVRRPTPKRDMSPFFAANLTPDLGSATSCAKAGVARARVRSNAAGRFMTVGLLFEWCGCASRPELVAGQDTPAVQKETQRGPQGPEPVDDALPEAHRRGVLEVAAGHRDLDDGQAGVEGLADHPGGGDGG